MQHIFFALLLIHFFTGTLLAQEINQTIRGSVVDQASQFPLPGASIVIMETDPLLGTITDISGNFRLEEVPVGRYDVRITFIGYEPFVIRELLVGSSKEIVLGVSLKESVMKMDEIVIKANSNKGASLNTMAPVSARQLSMEEANRYAGGFDDPARLASAFAGVASDVRTNGIAIRGNSPRGLLWRMEGIQIANPSHLANISTFGAGGITALSAQMLANSDFFTGAFPAEYGNALAGVFDIHLRNGNNEQREHTFGLSTIGIDLASEGPFKKGGKSSYLFNYRYSTFALVAPLLPENAGTFRYQDLSFKLNFPTDQAGTFSLWGLGAFDVTGAKVKTDPEEWAYNQDKEEVDSDLRNGAIGLNHRIFLNKKTFLQSSLAASGNGINWNLERLDEAIELQPMELIENDTWKLTAMSQINTKFSPRHNNITGVYYNRLFYNLNIEQSETPGDDLNVIARENGHSDLIQAFTQSRFDFGRRVSMTAGIHSQFFTLNNHFTVEPRIGVLWDFAPTKSLSFGYGNHSQLEMLQIYFVQIQQDNEVFKPNLGLDFSRAHHFILGYQQRLGNHTQIKVEPYYQILNSIPVIPNSTFSMINLQQNWFVNEALISDGTGRNVGLDVTVERFLQKGFYYLVTASIFDSKYTGGDGVERNTRYNKGYLFNLLVGKEWKVGKEDNNIFSINGRVNFMGGNWMSPVDEAASHEAEQVIYDDSKAFEEQMPNVHLLHFTVSYRKNRPKHSSIWSLQLINALGAPEFYGYKYNLMNDEIETDEEVLMMPNISYKIQF